MSMFFSSKRPRKPGRKFTGWAPGPNHVSTLGSRTDPTLTLQADGHRVSTAAMMYPRRRRNHRANGYQRAAAPAPRMFRVT